MRNTHFLNRVAPCLAIMTIGSVAAFALPTASYADTVGACKAVPPLTAPDMPRGANGECPRHYVPVEAENPQAMSPGAADTTPTGSDVAPRNAGPAAPNGGNGGVTGSGGANGK
jgi:hypothetical protein